MNNNQLLEILNKALAAFTHKVYGPHLYDSISIMFDSEAGMGLCNYFGKTLHPDEEKYEARVLTRKFIYKYIKFDLPLHLNVHEYWFPLTKEGDIERVEHLKKLIKHYIQNPIEEQ